MPRRRCSSACGRRSVPSRSRSSSRRRPSTSSSRPAARRAESAATRTRGGGGSTSHAAIAALDKRLPERDFYETNDDLGSRAYTTFGSNRRIQATVDYWDDQDDVYAISLDRNQPVYVGLTGADTTVDVSLAFWLPKSHSRSSGSSTPATGYELPRAEGRGSTSRIRPRGRRHVLRAGPHVEPGRDALPPRHRQGLGVREARRPETSRRTRAGLPTTIARAGTSFVTTAPAPTNASSPISTPGQRIAPPPTRAPRRIVGPAMSSWRALRAAHEVVVRRHDAGSDEDVVLERRVGGDVRLRLDLRQRAHRRVVLDQRAAAEHDVVADRDALADAGLVAEDHARADPRAGEDDRARSRRSCRRRSRSEAAARASRWSEARAPAACRRPRSRAP